ncbi:SGNH/GDSL hydrolase family protein [Parenemella sanctibonifatiensis]|uniref:SGNH hydrolase-type esterase domain-containing protein n=1 Tax=Parenemella sanctibonifatiensis TaxID=2016505 RepID=A0A255EKH9_9ACTN|nr:SGNH/GDSL hydrolase family protein [Parenemella sanctibonifatiensis]OYN92048.1 hypothetical protein CGZ91_00550 [Parenemella sanctibonifatiensis]
MDVVTPASKLTGPLILAGVAAAGLGAAAFHYFAGVQTMRPHVERHRAYWQDRGSQGERRYVALGDSSSQGVGVDDPRQAWVHGVANHLEQRWGTTVGVVNLSVSGATTADLVREQLPLLRDLLATDGAPDLLTVSIGVNDAVKARFDPDRFTANMTTIAETVPTGSFIGDLPGISGGGLLNRRIIRANEVIRRVVAAHGHRLVPVFEASQQPTLWEYRRLVAPDAFHPNVRGYQLWTHEWVAAIDRAGF